MAFKVSLYEHGVCLAEGKVRSIRGAIAWADSILLVGCERAFIGAFGQAIAKHEHGMWTKLPFHK